MSSTGHAGAISSRRRGGRGLVWHQVRFDLLAFSRNRQARFFTAAMPLGFLFLFVAIFGNGTLTHGGVRMSTYYVANLTAFAIVDAAFMALGITLVEARESGVLRRRQATPQPPWVVIAARAFTTLVTAVGIAVLLLVVGRVAYGASVPLGALPALAVAVVAGCLCGCSLGFAVTTLVRAAPAAQPVVMATAMPLFFISGVFVPWPLIPSWLRHVAVVFPVRPMAQAVLTPFSHAAGHGPWNLPDLAVLAAWGLGGLVVAVRRFRWAPQDAI